MMEPRTSHLMLVAAALSALLLMTPSAHPALADDVPAFPPGPGGVIMMSAWRGAPASPQFSDELKNKALQAGWSEADISALLSLLEALDRDRLPAGLVLDRARQGIVKGATVERIRTVAEKLGSQIRAGGRLVDGTFPAARESSPDDPAGQERVGLIDRTAFALEKGVPEASIAQIFSRMAERGRPEEQLQAMGAPVLAVASLTSEGLPPSEGVDFVVKASQAGVRGPDLENLGLALSQAIHEVPGPERAGIVHQVLVNLGHGMPPGQVIRELKGWRSRWGERPGRGPGLDDARRGRTPDHLPPVDPGSHGQARERRDSGKGGS